MNEAVIMLVDNGSKRATSTLNLRRLAIQLEGEAGHPVHAVSLQHADAVPTEQLDGQAAATFGPFVAQQIALGVQRFIVVPLFFGRSRALTSFIPEQLALLRQKHGDFELDVAEVLVPLPDGEPELAALLRDNIKSTAEGTAPKPEQIILVDHGSPLPEVAAVRTRLAQQLSPLLSAETELREAVMERRSGAEYDFSGKLLADVFAEIAAQTQEPTRVALAMLFFSPGRHAGPGGDIAEICAHAMQSHPQLDVVVSPLVGDHPGLVKILNARLQAALQRRPQIAVNRLH